MRKPLVAGNWKMHGSRAENTALLAAILQGLSGDGGVEVAVFPPVVYLADVVRAVKDTPVAVGAQNVCAEPVGAFTGEVAAAMLRDVGCKYVILGHSERRQIYREDDALVARKFLAVQQQKMIPILCVGETLDEREKAETEAVVARQLDAVLGLAGIAAFAQVVIAYEPVWAIGTGKNATPEQAQAVHAFIRGRLARQDAKIAAAIRILYGGSVKAANAGEIFAMPDVDGGLVGGASLKGEEFMRICAAARA
ncbi:MAG TPA: triose-phosphate isomerase [Steroidobacteraceae bacterium]|nr:triose-phosphate isomerase [Steroidobacteraceae bacterium]